MEVRKISRWLPEPERDFVYDLLRDLPLRLAVDVGAARGECTVRIKEIGGDGVEVVAFEPFPGNLSYFNAATNDMQGVSLIAKALSSRAGTASFVVPSVVQGDEPGWEAYKGYSSVGFLAPTSVLRRTKRALRTAVAGLSGHRRSSQCVRVETTTIDREFAGRTIDFMKIDVQGGEAEVLAGASAHLKAGDIGLLYIEWTGSEEVLRTLADCGYTTYDSLYVAGPRVYDHKAFEAIGFGQIKEAYLSTGKLAYEMVLQDGAASPLEALREVRRRQLGWAQTDLLAVSPRLLSAFTQALSGGAAAFARQDKEAQVG